MSHFKKICLIAGISLSVLISTSCSHTPPAKTKSVTLNTQALTQLDAQVLLKLFNFNNVEELMEAVVEKDQNYDGPAHLHPINKTLLQKTFLPKYYDLLDKMHSNEDPIVKARFNVGKGYQTQSVKPLDLTNIFLFLGGTKKRPDEPINPEVWGDISSRQLFEALEFPPVEKYGVIITAPNIARNGHIINSSQSTDTHLSLEAKNALGNWVYTLDMPIGLDTYDIKFTTPNASETYKVDGMTTQAAYSIKINNQIIFKKPATGKISDELREKLAQAK